jgi:hypothetical protein
MFTVLIHVDTCQRVACWLVDWTPLGRGTARKDFAVELGGLIWKLLTSEHLVYGWKIHAFF